MQIMETKCLNWITISRGEVWDQLRINETQMVWVFFPPSLSDDKGREGNQLQRPRAATRLHPGFTANISEKSESWESPSSPLSPCTPAWQLPPSIPPLPSPAPKNTPLLSPRKIPVPWPRTHTHTDQACLALSVEAISVIKTHFSGWMTNTQVRGRKMVLSFESKTVLRPPSRRTFKLELHVTNIMKFFFIIIVIILFTTPSVYFPNVFLVM